MYSPLTDPQRPAVTKRLATPLRGILRLSSSILGTLSIFLIASSVYMYVVYHRTGFVPPSPEPIPPPPAGLFVVTGSIEQQAYLHRQQAADKYYSSMQKNGSGTAAPWSIYTVGATGVYLMIVAVTGMSGSKTPDKRRHLLVHIALLAVFVVAQAAALLLIFTENNWKKKLPEDPSGWWNAALDFIDANSRVVKIVSLSLILGEIVVLGAASWLHNIYQTAYDDWIDDVDHRQAQAQQLLAQTAYSAHPGGTSWSFRMRDKYGVREQDWEEASRAVRQAARLSDDPEAAP